ncbi:MAG: M28 family peptidase [Steroidobacteraceae bacterium]
MRTGSCIAAASIAVALALPAACRTVPEGPAAVDPARLGSIVQTLASDEYEGRAPGTRGETRTVDYLIASFRALGLEPGGADGGWTQSVPLVRTQVGTPRALSVAIGGETRPLAQGEQVFVTTVRNAARIDVQAAPLVFVGYGVTAPERTWDDYKGVDLAGKIAVMLINDPDFHAAAGEPVAGRFGGRRMTYYGRWTYKFEEAARRGAIGTLIVHDADGVGYGWPTIVASGGEGFDLAGRNPSGQLALRGWLAHDYAATLFHDAGLDLAALRAQARRADFRPVAMNVTLTADLPVSIATTASRNVLAKLTGTKRPDETVMFAAHWDAYGIGAPDAAGRTVRAGANDDALGTAGVLELARVFAAGPRPQRTLVFALWTAEERGLLGSTAYAEHPLYPLAQTVADLTLDILQTAGPARDVLLVGEGQSELEDDLARAAKLQGRVVTPEALPERGLFYRADHFPLAKQGVPVLLLMAMSGGADLVEGGREAGNRWLEDYMRCYHQPCDRWSADWDLRGAAQDIELFHTIGGDLANSRRWPAWRAGSEFKATREVSRAAGSH